MPRLFRVLLVSLIAWGALAFGAVYPWAYWPLVAVSTALGLWGISATAAWRDPRTRTLAIALTAVATAIGLQLMPLPYEAVTRVSRGLDAFLRESRFGAQPAATWRPLSIAPGATAIALATFCALALLFVGLVRAIRHVGLPWLLTQLTGLGLGLAVFGVIQRVLLDRDRPLVYGFWQPVYGGNPFGPFINRNHFAGWMVMALPVIVGYSCGLALEAGGRPRHGWRSWLRWLPTVDANRVLVVGVTALVMTLALVVSGSRSGLASLALGLSAVAVLMWRRLPTRGARIAAATYLIVVVCGAIAWSGLNPMLDRFAPASRDLTSRMAAWRDTARIVEGFPFAGVGLGAYRDAMLVYQTGTRELLYAQAHNDYLQLAAEGGLLVGLPALVLLVVLARRIHRRLTSGDDGTMTRWIRAGAVGGLVAIGAQSIVEFSLQMPGNDVLFVILMALAVHRPARLPAHAHRV